MNTHEKIKAQLVQELQELQQANDSLLQTAIKILPVGLWIINAEGKIVISSAAAQKIWAGVRYVNVDQLGEYKGWRTDSGKLIEAHEWAGARALEKGETSIEEEVEIECFDGTHKIILDTAVPLLKSDGSIAGAITINQDITERKRANLKLEEQNKELALQNDEKEKRAAELVIANKELAFQNDEKEKRAAELVIAKEHAEQSDRLKTAFLANMSHEIRTPLNSILGFTSLLDDEDLSKDEIKSYTAIINQGSQRLLDIVTNVLDISRIQTGQVIIGQKAIVINSFISNLLTRFSPLARTKNLLLNYHDPEDNGITIHSDEDKLSQIFANLIENAIKYTKTGSIDFGYEIKDNSIQFYVSDTGIGIPAEYIERIYDRFRQIQLTLSKDYEGAGLGLAICKGLVELLGGRIWVESVVSQGTTVFFTLPFIPTNLPSQTKIDYLENPVKKDQAKILISEDDWISSQYLIKLLDNPRITVIHAENGKQAVELVRNTTDIDLILMDLRMPVMDGIEASKLIKKIRPNLPVIAQTAFTFSEDDNQTISVTCDEYLTKPVESDILFSVLNRYLKLTTPIPQH